MRLPTPFATCDLGRAMPGDGRDAKTKTATGALRLHECVGEGGFEPPTSCSQSRCAARLRYSPDLSGPDLDFSAQARTLSSSAALGVRIIRDV